MYGWQKSKNPYYKDDDLMPTFTKDELEKLSSAEKAFYKVIRFNAPENF